MTQQFHQVKLSNSDFVYRMSKLISNEQLDLLAAKAHFSVANEHREDFRASLSKIIDLFHAMSKVKVCEFKQYDNKDLSYYDLRNDVSKKGPDQQLTLSKCSHYNTSTQYFETPRVIEDET